MACGLPSNAYETQRAWSYFLGHANLGPGQQTDWFSLDKLTSAELSKLREFMEEEYADEAYSPSVLQVLRSVTPLPPERGLIERGSGNVFADLGLPNPDLALAKTELVRRIRELIEERSLTQAKAAALLGIDQPKVSALLCDRVKGYSIDRLIRFLNALGQRVEISVRPNGKEAVTRAGRESR